MTQQKMQESTVTGTPTERLIWIALWHTTWWAPVSFRELLDHVGGGDKPFKAALMRLVRRGIVDMEMDEDIALFRLSKKYAQQISLAYRRVYKGAMVLGGEREPTLREDIRAIGYLIGDFPRESVLAYAMARFPGGLPEQERKQVAKKLKAEVDAEKAAEYAQVTPELRQWLFD